MLAQSGTQAIIVTIVSPGAPAGGVTTFQPAESSSFDVQLLILNRATPDARVHMVSARSKDLTGLSVREVQEYYTPWDLGSGELVQAATRTSGMVFTMPFGPAATDVTYYARIVRVEATVATGEEGDLIVPEFSVISDEPSLPGLYVNTGVDEVPVFVTLNSWRGETEFTASGFKYLVVGLAVFD